MSVEAMQNTVTSEQAAAAGAGYMASIVLDNLADRFVPMDVPEEVTGIAAMALAAAYGGDYSTPLMVGAGVYTADAAATCQQSPKPGMFVLGRGGL